MIFKRQQNNDELAALLRTKEQAANRFLIQIGYVFVVTELIFWCCLHLKIYIASMAVGNWVLLGSSISAILLILVSHLLNYKGWFLKYLYIAHLLFTVFALNILTGYKIWIMYALPVVLASRYYNLRLMFATFLMACAGTIGNAWTNAYISARVGIMDMNTFTVISKPTVTIDKWLFSVIPQVKYDPYTIWTNSWKLQGVPNCIILALIRFACTGSILYNRQIIWEMSQSEAKRHAMELRLEDAKAKVMLSQIQPHFLYNSLNAIMAIEGNPDTTVNAINDFSRYLRANMDSLTASSLIPVRKELEHVKHYLALEKLRFEDRVQVELNLTDQEFMIPPLTIQMLAENAIKHGICPRIEGGTVWVITERTPTEHLVIVEDDGVGFDPNTVDVEGGHVGLQNVRARVEQYSHGKVEIESAPGQGTTVTIHIPIQKFPA